MMEIASLDPARAGEVAELQRTTAEELVRKFGTGPWKRAGGAASVARALTRGKVVVGAIDGAIVASLTLATQKPWAIDPRYFHPSTAPVYLTDMVVHPRHQRSGLGRTLLEAAAAMVRVWPGDAIRLDAYDAPAGGGGFYLKCGYTEVGRKRYRGTPLTYYELLL
jgi:GNAT superfamily N-acetyltransferase